MIRVTQRNHGPIYTHAADAAAHRFCDELEDDIADEAVDTLHRQFDMHFKHPTGYYKSQVKVRTGGPDKVISDGGVVYGPWLEGVGSRNFPKTRFKGYSSFRRAFQSIDRRAERMGQRLLRSKYLRRMG